VAFVRGVVEHQRDECLVVERAEIRWQAAALR
jgi:hypothetical protein